MTLLVSSAAGTTGAGYGKILSFADDGEPIGVFGDDRLARRLGVSQPHVSRVISGDIPPGNKLRLRIEKLIAIERQPEEPGKWLARVSAAAGQSEDFRRLVNLAMDMLEEKK
jgi:hypothetical protein